MGGDPPLGPQRRDHDRIEGGDLRVGGDIQLAQFRKALVVRAGADDPIDGGLQRVMPGLAAEFAVRVDRKAHRALQLDRIENRAIFDLAQPIGREPAQGVLASGVTQGRRAEQAAAVVGVDDGGHWRALRWQSRW
jgi:ubiquinone biosynthesis protein UbiJ